MEIGLSYRRGFRMAGQGRLRFLLLHRHSLHPQGSSHNNLQGHHLLRANHRHRIRARRHLRGREFLLPPHYHRFLLPAIKADTPRHEPTFRSSPRQVVATGEVSGGRFRIMCRKLRAATERQHSVWERRGNRAHVWRRSCPASQRMVHAQPFRRSISGAWLDVRSKRFSSA